MSDAYLSILKKYWGYDSFRGIQREIIESIGSGRDTLGLMPTGGGKSVTFQVPALCMEGVCIVVTPLIALMKDQVAGLRRKGIKAVAVYSGMTSEEVVVALENCIFGGFKFLYVSPERLSTEIFLKKVRHMKVSMITVDEAHCISQWGYDFRPSYLEIAEIRKLLPGVPVLALTATATPQVTDDIQDKLLFSSHNVFRMSFVRGNLAYVVRDAEDKVGEMKHILDCVPGSAIVYVRSRKRCKEICGFLTACGVSALFYHAGLDDEVKDMRQSAWSRGEARVMVATNAFGMGIDKPDVRCVIHVDVPDAPEAYFQEAGRAGRDGQRAYAVLLYSGKDKRLLHKRVSDSFPDKSYIKDVYEHMNYFLAVGEGSGLGHTFDFDLEEFCRRFGYFPVQAESALRILSRAGYIDYQEERDNASRLMFVIGREELYRIAELDEWSERLMRVVMRTYTGLFSEYVFISESSLSVHSGLSQEAVYSILSELTRRGIVSYIPRKNSPALTYLVERLDVKHIRIPEEVYEQRKAKMKERVDAMIAYCTDHESCRSRILTAYFGEKGGCNCGICDVCTRKTATSLRHGELHDMMDFLLAEIDKGNDLPENLLRACPGDRGKVEEVLRYMIGEEMVSIADGVLKRRN